MLKKLIISMVIVLTINNIAIASNLWTKEDTYREISFLVLNFIDYKQTRYIARHPDRFKELNPILGKHPSIGRVNSYFLATTIAHITIAYSLPEEYKKAFQYISIGISMTATELNLSGGIKIKF